MSAQFGVLYRVGRWFSGRASEDGPREPQTDVVDPQVESSPLLPAQVQPRRPSIFRPWARRDAAIAGLQHGVQSLSSLMDSIRENLDRQNQRQDEMLSYLAHLPAILQSLPESQRIHGETLKGIGRQLEQQILQQQQLTEILSRVGDASADQKQLLESLHERAETLQEHNEAISQNLKDVGSNLAQVGSAMETVGRGAESSTQLLQQLRDQQTSQQESMAHLVRQQEKRFNLLMTVTLVIAVAALGGASVVSYLLLHRPL